MGIIGTAKAAANWVDQKFNPLRQAADVLKTAGKPGPAQDEALQNAKIYSHAAKEIIGGIENRANQVRDLVTPTRNVDNSGIEVRQTPTGAVQKKRFPK